MSRLINGIAMQEVPAGRNRIGRTLDEEAAFGPDENQWTPAFVSAFPPTEIALDTFCFGPLILQRMTWAEANDLAASHGGRLISEAEWEVMARLFPDSLTPGWTEWCADYFDTRLVPPNGAMNPARLTMPDEPWGCPVGRRVIRGYGLALFAPSMRFHGGVGNTPIASVGARVVFGPPLVDFS